MKRIFWHKLNSIIIFIISIVKKDFIEKNDPSPLDHLKANAAKESYELFKEKMGNAMIFPYRPDMREFVIREAKAIQPSKLLCDEPLFLEFGVAGATSTNHFAKLLSNTNEKIYGFDAFLGLQEDWVGMLRGRTAGAYSYYGDLPKVLNNVELVVGWLQDTLSDFLNSKQEQKIVFAHFDMDTYLPGKFGLEMIKPYLVCGSIILFDDFYGFPGWKNSDFKSLNEIFNTDEYEFIAFSHTAAAIRILKSS